MKKNWRNKQRYSIYAEGNVYVPGEAGFSIKQYNLSPNDHIGEAVFVKT